MYQVPVNLAGSKLAASASALGTGHELSSGRCGTHCFSETAHAVNAPTTSLENSSPHLIWHSDSSGLFVHVWMHSRFAAQVGLVTQRARLAGQFAMRHFPMAAPSVIASAGCVVTSEPTSAPTSSPLAASAAPLNAAGRKPMRIGKRETLVGILLAIDRAPRVQRSRSKCSCPGVRCTRCKKQNGSTREFHERSPPAKVPSAFRGASPRVHPHVGTLWLARSLAGSLHRAH